MDSGQASEFEAFVLGYQKKAYAAAYRILGNVEDARDAVQEAFVKAFRSRQDFRGESAVTTWFHRVVVNTALDLMRRRRTLPPPVEDVTDGADEDVPPPEDRARRSEIRDVVRRAVYALPGRQRDVFLLKHFEGLSLKEVASTLGLAEGTAKVHLSRAVAALREELAGYEL